jgi:hypothetical protein
MTTPDVPFTLLEMIDLEEISEHPATKAYQHFVQAVDCMYKMWVYCPEGKEYLILQYLEEDGDTTVPDNIWNRIILLPAIGVGTELIQSDLLTIPISVITEKNFDALLEYHNDGIVSFEVNSPDVGKSVLEWVKNQTAKQMFDSLGKYIIECRKVALAKGGIEDFLKK